MSVPVPTRYWTLQESSGPWADREGTSGSLTAWGNSPSQATGLGGRNCLDFTASKEGLVLEAESIDSWDPTTESRSWGMVFRAATTPSGNQVVFCLKIDNDLWFGVSGGDYVPVASLGGTTTGDHGNTDVCSDGAFHVMFVTYDHTTETTYLYIDGSLDAQWSGVPDSLDYSQADSTGKEVASYSYGFDFQGWVHDVAEWQGTCLSASQVSEATNNINDGNEYDASGTVSDSIGLSEPDNLRIYQRNGTSKDITISGVYTGSPTSIEYRIIEESTGLPLTNHDWQVLDDSPSDDTFSGTVSIPQGGWYTIDVRFSNDTSISDTGQNKFAVGILVGTAGQSNIGRWWEIGDSSITPNDLVSVRHEGNPWQSPDADTMTGGIAFLNKLNDDLDVPVGVLDYAVGATEIAEWLNDTNGIWTDFITQVQDEGGELEYFLWHLGEEDSTQGTDKTTFKDNLTDFFTNKVRAEITNASQETNLPIIMAVTGKADNNEDADHSDIQYGQIEVADEIEDCYIGSYEITIEMVDSIHHTASGYAESGRRFAHTIEYILGVETYYRGPHISSAFKVDDTHIDATITHEGGSDFTPSSGITGFEVLDNGVSQTISSADRLDADTIRITLDSPLGSGPYILDYQYGASPDTSGAVYDNSSMNLPLELGAEFVSESSSTYVDAQIVSNFSIDNSISSQLIKNLQTTTGITLSPDISAVSILSGQLASAITLEVAVNGRLDAKILFTYLTGIDNIIQFPNLK